MANKVTVKALLQSISSPSVNELYVSVAPADNVYVTGGVALNLSQANIQDPQGIGAYGPSVVPPVTPGIFQESMAGYYAQVIPSSGVGSAGLALYKLQYFAPGGAEISAGAYPGAVTAGNVSLCILFNE